MDFYTRNSDQESNMQLQVPQQAEERPSCPLPASPTEHPVSQQAGLLQLSPVPPLD